MEKIAPFLWFDDRAEEAASFYVSLFGDSKILGISRYEAASANASGRAEGSVMSVTYALGGQTFIALNGGPAFKFSPSISFRVRCETQDEMHLLWDRLSADGDILMDMGTYPFSEQFGWLNDKYGLSWQLELGDGETKIVPLLWFSDKAEEAICFYTSLFDHSQITKRVRFSPGEKGPEGKVKYAAFTLHGREFMAMDANPEGFVPAISLFVNCETQGEVDQLWKRLSTGGDPGRCGWISDRYGVSWQIVPTALGRLLAGSDTAKSNRVLKAMLGMGKLEIASLERAYEGG